MPFPCLNSSLIIASLLGFAASLVAAPDSRAAPHLIKVQVLEAAQAARPPLIITSLAPGLQDKYCNLTLSSELSLESSAYMLETGELAWKKLRFAAGSQLLISAPRSFGEWPVATVVDEETGTLTFNIPQDAATVVCESGAYTLGETPLLAQPLAVFADPQLEQALCTLPAGLFAGTATAMETERETVTELHGAALLELCRQEQGFSSLSIPLIRPHQRLE